MKAAMTFSYISAQFRAIVTRRLKKDKKVSFDVEADPKNAAKLRAINVVAK